MPTPDLDRLKKSVPANNVKGLICWLKAEQGKASLGTVGVVSPCEVP